MGWRSAPYGYRSSRPDRKCRPGGSDAPHRPTLSDSSIITCSLRGGHRGYRRPTPTEHCWMRWTGLDAVARQVFLPCTTAQCRGGDGRRSDRCSNELRRARVASDDQHGPLGRRRRPLYEEFLYELAMHAWAGGRPHWHPLPRQRNSWELAESRVDRGHWPGGSHVLSAAVAGWLSHRTFWRVALPRDPKRIDEWKILPGQFRGYRQTIQVAVHARRPPTTDEDSRPAT